MNSPATIDGIALIASTSMRTGRTSVPPISLRNTAVANPERHRDQRRDARPAPACRRSRATRRRGVAGSSGPTLRLVLGEEVRAQRVIPLRDHADHDRDERDEHDERRRSRRACARGGRVAASTSSLLRRRRAKLIATNADPPRPQEPEPAGERREPLVDQPGERERRDARRRPSRRRCRGPTRFAAAWLVEDGCARRDVGPSAVDARACRRSGR